LAVRVVRGDPPAEGVGISLGRGEEPETDGGSVEYQLERVRVGRVVPEAVGCDAVDGLEDARHVRHPTVLTVRFDLEEDTGCVTGVLGPRSDLRGGVVVAVLPPTE